MKEKLVVIGLGLIGGSLALDLKRRCGYTVFGLDQNKAHVARALERGIIDHTGSEEDLNDADVVIIAVPVDKIAEVAVSVLDRVGNQALVFDVGSVKEAICAAVKDHPKRNNFLAAHPLAGTEFSGPEAALTDLFDEKVNILCEPDKTDWKVLDRAIGIFKKLNMRIKMMSPAEHDRHIAYVSHLSHVSSFMLGKTVLEIEKNEQHIFDMASTGFASTVRLAKSSPKTWSPIFVGNQENIVRALEEYIKNLVEFKDLMASGNGVALEGIMTDTNYLKTILNGIKENQTQ
jgi:prephenate dehydrogenase